MYRAYRFVQIIGYIKKGIIQNQAYEDKRINIDNSRLLEIICDENLHIIFQ